MILTVIYRPDFLTGVFYKLGVLINEVTHLLPVVKVVKK